MKLVFLTGLMLVLFSARSMGQVGINDNSSLPDNSAMLDVHSSSKGMLIPRVALTGKNDVTTISSPAMSLLIYNTATAGTPPNSVKPGFYYSNGSGSWISLALSPGTTVGDMLIWDGSQWTILPPGGNGMVLGMRAGVPTWGFFPGIPDLVTTDPGSNILAFSATSGGTCSDGGALIISKGVCWSLSPNPTTSDSKTNEGPGEGTFTSSLTGLTFSTTYHVRAYATNSVGTSYGSDITFTTRNGVASLTTIAATNGPAGWTIVASSGGNITDNGGTQITARGICWSTSHNPTTANNKTIDGSGNGTFTSNLTALTASTVYYVRAYATNVLLTTYGNEITFTSWPFVLGDSYAGGLIIYLDGTGIHGYVCATTDQSTGAVWGCYGTDLAGAQGTAVGTGNQNTLDIINGCGTAGIAARLCSDLVLNGYDDWFLPSKAEIELMYTLSTHSLGGFSSVYYWTSSEYDFTYGTRRGFWSGGEYYAYISKNNAYYVRAMRAF